MLNVPESFPEANPARAIYCSRTLNLRSIKAIGYDMVGCTACTGLHCTACTALHCHVLPCTVLY